MGVSTINKLKTNKWIEFVSNLSKNLTFDIFDVIAISINKLKLINNKARFA